MPDPVSRCPIFGRLEDVTSDPDNVNEGIIWMKRYQQDFILAGTEMDVLTDEECWHLPADPLKISEIKYLSSFFFPPNAWWKAAKVAFHAKHGRTFFDGFSKEIFAALKKSSALSEMQGGNPVPIQGYWECIGEAITVGWRVSPKKHAIWFRVQTPPPEADYTCTP